MNDLIRKLTADEEKIQISLYIMEERRNPVSTWRDYIALLPKDWSSVPLFYSEDELDWLKGSDVFQEILLDKKNLKADYSMITKNIPEFTYEYSFREFLETYAAVQSRAFQQESSGRNNVVLVPFIDLFSQSNESGIDYTEKITRE